MIQACANRVDMTESQKKMAQKVQPSLDRSREQPGDLVENAAKANAAMIAEILRNEGPVLPGLVNEGALKVAPAYYDLETGKVDWRF